jgi:outer membrane protein assembly factor BamE (lipoprotein component of BamABCDE complex)
VKAVKTRQNAESKLVSNTWAYIFKYKSPNKFGNVKENTDEVVASTWFEEQDNRKQNADDNNPQHLHHHHHHQEETRRVQEDLRVAII